MKTFGIIAASFAALCVFACKQEKPEQKDLTPTLVSVVPASGGAGDLVEINGSNFSMKTPENAVYFGDVEAEIEFAYDDMLQVRVPAGAGKTVSVEVNGVRSKESLDFEYIPAWVLKSLTAMESGKTDASSALADAKFRYITNMCQDENGDIYVAERCTHTIKKISLANNTVEVFAGVARLDADSEWGNTPGQYFKDGALKEAQFNGPRDIIYVGNNTFYVADCDNNAIRKIQNGQVTTVGKQRIETGGEEWTDVQMYENTDYKMSLDKFRFSRPQCLLYDKENNDLYVSSFSHYVVRVDIDANEVELIAGTPFNNLDPGTEGGPHTGKLSCPIGLAMDKEGNLYISNEYGYFISKLDRNHNLTVFAGQPGVAGAVDGVGKEAKFNQLEYMVMLDNSLLVSDFRNHCIRKIDLADAKVTTWAGTLEYNDSKDGGLAECKVSWPLGLAKSYDGTKIFMSQAETYEGLRVFAKE